MNPFTLPGVAHDRVEEFRTALAAVDDESRIRALEWFLPRFQAHYNWLLRAPRPRYDARIGAGDETLRTIQDEGCFFGKIDPELKARLAGLTEPLIPDLMADLNQRSKPRFRFGQMELTPAEHPEVLALIEQAFGDAGFWDIVSAYTGDRVALGNVALQVNTPHATRYRHGEIGADGLPPLRTDYFHIDSGGWPHLKVLIYLNDVGLDQGPFRYVPGSHLWTDPFELAVRKAHDKHKTPPEILMALPEPLRLLAHFGPYMDPDGPEAAAFLAGERAFYDDEGSDLVLFDYHGVHRGGFVRQGSRHILQCNFAPGDPDGPAWQAKMSSPR